jgi:hypothetical protein
MIERTRIEAVLNRIRPLLQADGANIELVDVRSDGVSVRLIGLVSAKPLRSRFTWDSATSSVRRFLTSASCDSCDATSLP